MDRLDAMAMFIAVVDAGSLAGAARKLGRSSPAITRAVALLEEQVGEKLLHRSTRQLRLTEAGQWRLGIYRSVLAELEAADSAQVGGRGLSGVISITAPELFGRLKLMPVVESFISANPEVRARLLFVNRVVNLVEEGMDVAVRLAHLPDSRMVAVKLGEVQRLVCASPDYLGKAGDPLAPADLASHCCIGEGESTERELWSFLLKGKVRPRTISVAVRPRMAVNSAGAAVDAAVRGGGLVRALSYQVAEHLQAGRLKVVLADFVPEPLPVHIVFHPGSRRGGIVRAFVDHSTQTLRRELKTVSEHAGGWSSSDDL